MAAGPRAGPAAVFVTGRLASSLLSRPRTAICWRRDMDRPVMTVRRTTSWDPGWTGWHLDWSAVWTGALAMLVAGAAFSLIALAVGAQKAVDPRILKWSEVGIGTIAFSVFGAFLASAIGAWTAARMSGARLAEPAVLHGVVAWLVLMGIVMFFATI